MSELGLELDFDVFVALLRTVKFSDPRRVADQFFRLAHEALHGPHGYAWEYSVGATMLVAQVGDEVVFGVQNSTTTRRPFPPWGWKIERWSKDLSKNRDQVAAWAKVETRGVVRAKLVRPPMQVAPRGKARDDGAALLAAVVANPDDAGARRVYADWLLEQGDQRGELIRLHQEGKDTLALARKHAPVMLAPWAKLDAGTTVRSGFIDELRAYAGKLAAQPEIFEREPFRSLHLVVMKPDELAKLARGCGERLARITHLVLEGRKSAKYLAAVPTRPAVLAPLLSGVTKLEVQRLDERPAEWRGLFDGLTSLRELQIDDVPRAVLMMLDERELLPALSSISIGFQGWANGRGAAQAVELARVLAKRKLASVSISSWHCGSEAMVRVADALLSSPRTHVTLDNCTMSEEARAGLAKRPRLTLER